MYAYTDHKGKEVCIGKINLQSYKTYNRKLTIVPLGISDDYDAGALKKHLDNIYQGALATFEVDIDPTWKSGTSNWQALQSTLGVTEDWALTIGKDEERKDFSPQMGQIASAYRKTITEEPDHFYVFVINDFTGGEDEVKGYFPRSKAFGFVKQDAEFNNTLAHELGHGIGNLKHTWEKYKTQKSSTKCLMDYGGGTHLLRDDWGFVQNPGIRFGWGDKVEDGKRLVVNDISQISKLRDNEDGGYSFLQPDGNIFRIKGEISKLIFSTGDLTEGLSKDKSKGCKIDIIPFGTLLEFEVDNIFYQAQLGCDTEQFFGYKDESDKTKESLSVESDSVIIAYPCFDEGVIFSVKKVAIAELPDFSKTTNNSLIVYDRLKGLFNNPNLTINADLSPALGKTASSYLDKVSEHIGCGDERTIYTFSHALQAERYPEVFATCAIEGYDLTNEISNIVGVEIQNPQVGVDIYSTIENEIDKQLKLGLLDGADGLKGYQLLEKKYKVLADIIHNQPNSEDIIQLLNEYYYIPCIWKRIPFDDRKAALTSLLAGELTDWLVGNDNSENIFNLLVTSTPKEDWGELLKFFYTDNAKNLVEVIRKTNDFWDQTSMDELLQHLTLIDLKYDPPSKSNNTNKVVFPMGEVKNTEGEDISNFTITWSGSKISLKARDYWGEKKDVEDSFIPDERVVVDFKSQFTVKGLDGKYIDKGTKIEVPAFYVWWLIERQHKNNTIDDLRLTVDAVVIVGSIIAAPYTGGASLTLLKIDAAIAGADIVFTLNKENIIEQLPEKADEIIKKWDDFVAVSGLATLSGMGVISVVDGSLMVSLNNLKANINRLDDVEISRLYSKVHEFSNEVISDLNRVKNGFGKLLPSAIQSLNELKSIDLGRRLKNVPTAYKDLKLAVKNNTYAIAFYLNTEYQLAKVSKGTDLILDQIQWVNTGTRVGKIENIRYLDEAGNVREETLELVEGVNREIGLRRVFKAGVKLEFANDIIRARYEELIKFVPPNLKPKLDDIVSNVSNDEVCGEVLMDLFLGSERSSISGLIDRFNLSTNLNFFDDLLSYISKHKNNNTQMSSVSSYLDGVNDVNILNKIIVEGIPVEHIFRGTSQNFGGKGNAAVGVTSTSVDPVSSVIFGLNSDYLSGRKGVLKISDVNSLKNVDLGFPNVISKIEMELALNIPPSNFSNYVTKEIPIEQARQVLKDFGIDLPSSSSFKTVEDVNYYIKKTRKLTPKEVIRFVSIINN